MLRPPLKLDLDKGTEELFKKAVEVTVEYERSSPSLLQRKLSIGYARAARLLDQLEAAGVVGPADGSKPREVLIHSYDEFFAKGGERPRNEQENVFEVPANYKAPTDLKLSLANAPLWETQFGDAIKAKDFKETQVKFPVLLGYDDEEKLHIESLLDVNSLILVGNPVSKKEIFIDTVLLTLLLRNTPSQLRLVLNDPTHYLDLFNGTPHLLSPVINEHDKVRSGLRWSQAEMDRRFKMFAELGVRDIEAFNKMSGFEALPHILVVTFLVFPDIEATDALTLLTSTGARAGIHNILVVDQANENSIPGSIRNNVPARVVFRVASASVGRNTSVNGAENLGIGEMLFKSNFGKQIKLKSIFTPEVNVKEVVEAVKQT
jgi:DNA segregation ATPase FtsK/SpoIIIE, S-DNA-T family